ncbi:MAG: CZB domain-containing protein [Hydrogenophaga sp.]|uniref:CZB domain-containing protein n=1 Tax=Hydrogenophaga sp. TaxID=1904254 RepID=UPI001A62ABDF|nr:CZB domain-containing protein [Hydrogenophaga sp.]
MNLQRLLDRLPWSRQRPRPSVDPAPVAPEPAGQTSPDRMPRLDRLDLQAAVIHHLEWCVLFNEHLSVDASQAQHQTPLPDADNSALGQWLHKMAQRPVGQHPHFLALQQEHRRFHELAREALEHSRNQRMDLASTLLNTEFERSRARVLEMLRQMQRG